MDNKTRNKIVKAINSLLRKQWSDKDAKKGKKISFLPKYNVYLNKILPQYQQKGWEVTKNVMVTATGRMIYLNFKNPYVK